MVWLVTSTVTDTLAKNCTYHVGIATALNLRLTMHLYSIACTGVSATASLIPVSAVSAAASLIPGPAVSATVTLGPGPGVSAAVTLSPGSAVLISLARFCTCTRWACN